MIGVIVTAYMVWKLPTWSCLAWCSAVMLLFQVVMLWNAHDDMMAAAARYQIFEGRWEGQVVGSVIVQAAMWAIGSGIILFRRHKI